MATTRTHFDRELSSLQNELLLLGSMVQKGVIQALDALRSRDLAASEQVIKDDDLIDKKRWAIEDRCIDLIATQQPLAGDLRIIVTILHISVELERMGDYAEGIGKISLLMADQPPVKPLIDIPRMADKAVDMIRRSLEALVSRDEAMARQVCSDDDEVDALYEQVYRELLMIMLQDPKTVERATYLLWTAHDIERLADRATNIAERVIFLVTGRLTGVNASRY